MSGHARRVPEASVHRAVWRSPGSFRRSLPCHAITVILFKVAVCAANAFNLNRFRSRSLSRRPCSLASRSFVHSFAEVHVARRSAWTFHHHEIFECAHLKFTVSGRSKQTSRYTHAWAMQSHLSTKPMLCMHIYPKSTIHYWVGPCNNLAAVMLLRMTNFTEIPT